MAYIADDQAVEEAHLALGVRRAGQDSFEPARLKSLTFRLPFSLVASIDAFVSITGDSRNTTMLHLLEAGIFAVVNELDDDEQYQAARAHFVEKYSELD